MDLPSTEIAASVLEPFDSIVRRHADHAAVISATGGLTYGELDAAANRLAARVAAVSRPGEPVAILLQQEPPMFVAMLAILKSGRIVFTLNPADPPARLEQLWLNADPTLILTDHTHREIALRLAGDRAGLVLVDEPADGPVTKPAAPISPGDTAFLIYTSGSTGAPKGVMQTHGYILDNAEGLLRTIEVTAADRTALLASMSGGQAVNTVWTTFLAGGTVVCFDGLGQGLAGLADWMTKERITIYVSASSIFRHVMKTISASRRFSLVRIVKISSDAATWDDFVAFKQHFPDARFVQTMGSSEAGTYASMVLSHAAAMGEGRIPIGRAAKDKILAIVDDNGIECPPGTVGTVTVKSRYLAAGYWRDPELTAVHFRDAADGMRVYTGGDLGRLSADGILDLAGRSDGTIKIRGYRVDVGEVEKAIAGFPGIASAAVLAAEGHNGVPQLVAYVVLTESGLFSAARLRVLARATLPRQMVPSSFVVLESMPRAPNGKADRARLRGTRPPTSGRASVPAADATEALMLTAWTQAFGSEEIGVTDDFFDLGGDSLIAAVVAARIQSALGVEVQFASFIECPTPREMASFVAKEAADGRGEDDPLVPLPRTGPVALSLYQQPIWKASRSLRPSARFTRANALQIDGALDVAAFRRSIARVIDRHEILRTRYPLVDGAPVQVIEPAGPPDLPFLDFADRDDAEAEATRLLADEAATFFDFSVAPPLRLTLVRLRPNRHWLIRSSHHILSDAPSWTIFDHDLASFYGVETRGEPPPEPLPIQYADYSIWQRRLWAAQGSAARSSLDWWEERLLQTPPRFDLPYTRKKPAGPLVPKDWHLAWGLDRSTSARLDALGSSEGATYYMVRVAGLVPLLAFLAGSDRIALAGVFTNRRRVEIEGLFGLFATFLPIVLDCDWDLSFRQLIVRVRQSVLDVQSHASVPWAELEASMAERQVRMPALRVRVHMATPRPSLRFADLAARAIAPPSPAPPLGINLHFDQFDEESGGSLVFDARIYEPTGMQDLLARVVRTFARLAEEPDVPLRKVPHLTRPVAAA